MLVFYAEEENYKQVLDLHGNRTRGHFVHHVQRAEEEWATKFLAPSGDSNVSACYLYGNECIPEGGFDWGRENCGRNCQCQFRPGSKCVHSDENEGRTIHVLVGRHHLSAQKTRTEKDLQI